MNLISQYKGLRKENYVLCFGRFVTAMGAMVRPSADDDLKPEAWDECLKKDDEMFWYFVIRFLAATGARVSELIQIKAEHVKLGHLDLYSKGGKLRRI